MGGSVQMSSDYINTKMAKKRVPLANEVANRIADYIQQEEFMPGDRITATLSSDEFKIIKNPST